MKRFLCISCLVCLLSFQIILCSSEHSLTYLCTEASTVTNGTVDAVEGQITEFQLSNSTVCEITCLAGGEGESVEWRNLFGNIASSICREGSVCQRFISINEGVLKLDTIKNPVEYICDIQRGAITSFFHVRFLLPNTVIPDIIISTQPYFPVINDIVTVSDPNINIICSSNGYPTPRYEIQYDSLYTEDNELSIGLEFTDTPEYIMCTADIGIRVLRRVLLVPDFSIDQEPANFSFTRVSNSIHLLWQPVSNHFEEYTNYSISYSSSEDDVITINSKPSLMNGWYNYTLNLEYCTEYNISIYGYNRIGDGPALSTLTYTLPTKITDAPLHSSRLAEGTTFLVLAWREVSARSCSISPITYQLSYASTWPTNTSSGVYHIDRAVVERNRLSSGELYFIVKGLEEFYEYRVTLLARNTEGNGPAITSTYRTLPDVPSSPPQDLELVHDDDTLRWNAPAIQYQNGIISNYSVELEYEFSNRTKVYREFAVIETSALIQRYADDVMIRVMVSVANQIGKGPAASILIHAIIPTSSSLPTPTLTHASTVSDIEYSSPLIIGISILGFLLTICAIIIISLIVLVIFMARKTNQSNSSAPFNPYECIDPVKMSSPTQQSPHEYVPMNSPTQQQSPQDNVPMSSV